MKKKPTDNKYRTKEERVANAAALKKGRNVVLLKTVMSVSPADVGECEAYCPMKEKEVRSMSVGALMDKLNITEMFYKVAGETECIRDQNDIDAVLEQNNIVGQILPVRAMDVVERFPQQVFSIVRPNSRVGHPEEASGDEE